MGIQRILNLMTNPANTIWCHADSKTTRTEEGSILSPYRTLEGAVAALTSARPNILVMPGEYTIEETLALPTTHGCSITAVGGEVEINAAVTVTPLISIAPAATGGTAVYRTNGLYIANVETSQLGVQIDNADAEHKTLWILNDCHIEKDSGTAIDVDHDGVPTVRIYANRCEIEGSINFDVGNPQDRFWATNCEIMGLLTSKGDNTLCEFRYMNCLVKATACAVNSGLTTQCFMSLGTKSVIVTDDELTARTYAALVSADIGTAGDFTETIVD